MARTQIDQSLVPVSQNAPNILINGGFEFWQRNTTFSAPASGAYTADRWSVYTNEASGVTLTQESTTIDSGTYSAKIVVASAGASTQWHFQQLVENAINYRGKTITFSARVRSSVASALRIGLQDDSSVTYSSYHTGGGGWETLTLTKTLSGTLTSLYVYVGMVGNGTKLVGTYYIDSCMIVVGSLPSVFVPPAYADELARCQRFYQKSYAINTPPGTISGSDIHNMAGNNWGSSAAFVVSQAFPFAVRMRVAPTVTLYNYSLLNTTGQWSWIAQSSVSGVQTDRTTTTYFVTVVSFAVKQQLATDLASYGHWTADAEM